MSGILPQDRHVHYPCNFPWGHNLLQIFSFGLCSIFVLARIFLVSGHVLALALIFFNYLPNLLLFFNFCCLLPFSMFLTEFVSLVYWSSLLVGFVVAFCVVCFRFSCSCFCVLSFAPLPYPHSPSGGGGRVWVGPGVVLLLSLLSSPDRCTFAYIFGIMYVCPPPTLIDSFCPLASVLWISAV